MINGDISNETPPRIIVMIDSVVESEVETKNRLFLGNQEERKVTKLNRTALSHLWTIANRYGLSVELAAFHSDLWSETHLSDLMEKLDRRGGNPFNYAELYDSVQDFMDELPYRPNLRGVVDQPKNVARYGSYGIELNNL